MRGHSQLKSPEPPAFCASGGAIRAAKSVGSLVTLARSACSGTLDGSDKMDVALLRSRRDDKAAMKTKQNEGLTCFCSLKFSCWRAITYKVLS